MKRFVLAALLVAGSALPAAATSVTIDSTNCNSSGGCYGLSWTLQVLSGTFTGLLDTYSYKAILTVTDDALVSGTPTAVISAVDFKASSSVSGAELWSSPTNSGGWTTYLNNLSSGGCTGGGSGHVCSSTATNVADFPNLTSLAWTWYFDSNAAVAQIGDELHIGAKMTTLSTSGKLLSAHATVPEPATLSLLGFGLVALGLRKRTVRSRLQ